MGNVLFCIGIALCAMITTPAWACTTFCMNEGDDLVVAKSYDWDQGEGLVITNKAGVAKQALPSPEGKPATWVSKYASVTFNQYGRELPNGGMNEKGLVVEVMWLDEARYEAPDKRPTVTELQWIQYQLDNFASVAEVAKNLQTVRVSPVYAKVHYMVCDASGACASVEHVGEKLVVAAAEPRVLTNDTQKASTAYLRRHVGFGGSAAIPKSKSSLDRFVRAANHSKSERASNEESVVSDAFAALDDVRNGDRTQWQIVYQPATLRISFRTRKTPKIKHVRVTDFGSSCQTPVQLLDIDADAHGDVRESFSSYSKQANARLLRRTLEPLAGSIPAKLRAQVAGYPDQLQCTLTQ